jgi:endonuclease/exonuclease/phosphatase (EEP) superfamily protein YafD
MGAAQPKPFAFNVLVVNAERFSNEQTAEAIARKFPREDGLAFLSEWGPKSTTNPGNFLVEAAADVGAGGGTPLEYVSANISSKTPDLAGVAWDSRTFEKEKNEKQGVLRLAHTEARTTLAILRHKQTNRRVFCLSVHMFLENKTKEREAGIGKLAELIAGLKEKDGDALILVGGDLNRPMSHIKKEFEPLGFEAVRGGNEEIENLFFSRPNGVRARVESMQRVDYRDKDGGSKQFDHPFLLFSVTA